MFCLVGGNLIEQVRGARDECVTDSLAYNRLKSKDPDFEIYREALEQRMKETSGGATQAK